jgi:ACS family hexuronate transporter-like MFS transporter
METTSRKWSWKLCVFLLFATALSYLDRQSLSIAAPVIRQELRLDNAQLGLLLSAFFYAYAVMHLGAGWILDRFNIRVVYPLFVLAWSFAQCATGLAGSFAGLFTARAFLGGFEAAAQPGAARIIAATVPKESRSLANGIMMSGGSLGAIIAPALMISLIRTAGWRPGFILLAAFGAVWTAVWVLWFRPAAGVLERCPKAEPALQDQWSTILRSPCFWACVVGALFAIPIIHISSSWIPTYFVQEWKLPLSAGLGLYLVVIYLGLDLGFLGGGAAVSLLIRKGYAVGRARSIVMIVSALLMMSAAATPWMPSATCAVALVFAMNIGRASWGANFLAFNQDIAPGRVGLMAGVMGCIGAFSGALLVLSIGVISKAVGFTVPLLMIAALAALGTLPFLVVDWDKRRI